MVGPILVVDDDAALRGIVVRLLRSWGHTVISEAGSVAEALACGEASRPETALIDIGLPDGDGFTLTGELRARGWATRVVPFCTDADRANVAAAERAGAIAFLPEDELSSPALQRFLAGATDGTG